MIENELNHIFGQITNWNCLKKSKINKDMSYCIYMILKFSCTCTAKKEGDEYEESYCSKLQHLPRVFN